METVCEYTSDAPYMTISTDERKMINRLLKFAEQRPNEVSVLAYPEKNDGCLYIRCPKDYLKIAPKTRRNMSDEERTRRGEMLRNAREKRRKITGS